MREHKYRAWDNERKKMIYDFSEHQTRLEDDGTIVVGDYNRKFFANFKDSSTGDGDWYECELLQFTGLKDKNGKQIYVGDIIKISCWEERKHYKDAKKKDCEGVFVVNVENRSWGDTFNFENISGYPCSTHLDLGKDKNWNSVNIKVIGNIYENKRLLK